jgi:uncharacterized protein (TIGR03067 family)
MLVGLFLIAPVPDAAEEAKKKILGSWVVVSGENRGRPLPPEEIAALRVVITEDKFILRWSPQKSATFSYSLDPTTDPKQFDTTCLDEGFKGIVCRGIYKFEGDHLVLCKNTRGTNDRPKDYKTSVQSGFALYELKREKP